MVGQALGGLALRCRLSRPIRLTLQSGLSSSYIRLIPSGPLGSAGVTPRHGRGLRLPLGYYGPIRLPTLPAPRLCLPDGPHNVAWGLSVPGLIVRHAPPLLTPGSRPAACTRCFTGRAGFVQSDGLAAPTGVTRLVRVRLPLRLAPSPRRGFARRVAPIERPVGYMANGSFHGELLSVHETRLVSLTHRISRMTRMGRDGGPHFLSVASV